VLSAIHLDDQPRPEADEIEDVSAKWRLALEFQPFQLDTSKNLPIPTVS
jgi:hypothetical protein